SSPTGRPDSTASRSPSDSAGRVARPGSPVDVDRFGRVSSRLRSTSRSVRDRSSPLVTAPAVRVAWRPVTVTDFPLLEDWLARPHVHRYWHHDHSPEGVARDFGPGTRGEEAGEDLLVSIDGRPAGLVQRSRIEDYAEDFEDLG